MEVVIQGCAGVDRRGQSERSTILKILEGLICICTFQVHSQNAVQQVSFDVHREINCASIRTNSPT